MLRIPPRLDRKKLKIKPLALRASKVDASILLPLSTPAPEIAPAERQRIEALAQAMLQARQNKASILLIYGAHLFRNGASPMIIDLMKRGLITQLTTNGAGGIHDWELAFHGRTTEDVKKYLDEGQFGIWQETGLLQNLALGLGAALGLGYGQSLGKMMAEGCLQLPDAAAWQQELAMSLQKGIQQGEGLPPHFAGKAALLETMETLGLPAGKIDTPHPGREFSLLYQAYALGIPLNICPGIGYDIIYNHPANHGASLGQAAVADFLSFAQGVKGLEQGVCLSVGSAVMSPMILEKALSMARNLALQEGVPLNDFKLAVVDMQPGTWDWAKDGEPPKNHPAYFLRFCKSFSRMGGEFTYHELDNRDFFLNLYHAVNRLEGYSPQAGGA